MPQKSLPIGRQGAFSHFLLGALQFQVLHLTSHLFPVNFCVCWKTGLVSFFCMWLTSVPSTTEEVTPSPLWMPGVPVGNWLATHTGGYFPALYSVPLLWMRFCASAMYDALMAKALWYNRKYDAELCSSSRLRSGLLWKTQIIRKIITQILELFFSHFCEKHHWNSYWNCADSAGRFGRHGRFDTALPAWGNGAATTRVSSRLLHQCLRVPRVQLF